MKRQHAVVLGGAGLLFVFVLAGYLYKSQRAAEIEVCVRDVRRGKGGSMPGSNSAIASRAASA